MTDPSVELIAHLAAALGPQYRVERELGRGGMGIVFQVTDLTLDRTVAVKVVHPELAAHRTIAQRFLAEARTSARVRHPNIVSVHAAAIADGLLYYVMDDVAGESLRQRLARERRLPAARVVQIVTDVAAALDAAAAAGVVHRDVKPENILLDSATGRALLVDFGIARAMAAELPGTTTGQGIAIGTPAYMSPEQALGEEVDNRSDIYALGIVAYEALTGAPPFQGPHRVVVSRHIAERPAALDRICPEAPPALAEAVMRALEKSPEARWQSGRALRDAIAGNLPHPRRARNRRWLAGAALVAAVLAGGSALALRARAGNGPPAGINPRHSILVLPFDNLRNDRDVEWLRDGSVNMLTLNLSQWNDLRVVDHERLHDILAKNQLNSTGSIGLDRARLLAREAGAWTVVLGDFARGGERGGGERGGDTLHLVARVYDVATGERVDVARVDAPATDDVRPLFDQLANKLLDLSGAPTDTRTGLVQATTPSLEAYRSYLAGLEALNSWNLDSADRAFRKAVSIDTTFGLAFYKLALTRGWMSGTHDAVADAAIARAVRYSSALPAHEQTIIHAYRALLAEDLGNARALYQQLLQRNAGDADAWYGLGEAWFHDNSLADMSARYTNSLRAFHRTVELDPYYVLAYEHMDFMLQLTAREGAPFALLPRDSIVRSRAAEDGRLLLDKGTIAAAELRARQAEVDLARRWVTIQPTVPRAHGALVDAFVVSGRFGEALQEVERFRTAVPAQPDLPFIEAGVRLAAGQADRAAQSLRRVLDSIGPKDFNGTSTMEAQANVAAAANVFAYTGDLTSAARVIELAHEIIVEAEAQGPMAGIHDHAGWRVKALSELYGAVGGPRSALRQTWQTAADAGRSAPIDERRGIAQRGGAAAIGLFVGPDADTSAIQELEALTGETPGKEVRALLALTHNDTTAARRALAEPDPPISWSDKEPSSLLRRPLAAQAYFTLGEYQIAVNLLHDFDERILPTNRFDMRWGMLGRVRLLRGAAYEKLGRRTEAAQEYKQAIAQWKGADPALKPYIQAAERGLARLQGEG